jgi:MFS-type transporter involved in bile tolerance (Atg22 family)
VGDQARQIPMRTALIIVAIFAMVLAVPAIVWLTKLIRPPKPENEAIDRRIEEARRRLDRTHY